MIRRNLSLSLGLFASLAASGGLPEATRAQEPPPTFPARVEQVTVDVVVVDKAGNAITGLKPEDLEVYENGVRQTIVSFEPVVVAAAPAPQPSLPPRVSTNSTVKEGPRGRTFVIVFDDLHLTAFTAVQAKAAVASFLKTDTREGDRVTLVATGGGSWWSARMEAGRDSMIERVKRLVGRYVPDTSRERLSEYEAMRIHVFRDEMIMNRVQRRYETAAVPTTLERGKNRTDIRGAEDPVVTSRASEVYYSATARNHVSLEAVERSLNALVRIKGRKSLILVSNGFIYDPNLPEFKRLIEASRRASTAIYFVNSRGLEGLPTSLTADLSAPLPAQDIGFAFSEALEESEGSESVALDSGGFVVRNNNDLASGFKRIADETRAYYLIGYNPANTARDGLFRKIQVKVPGKRGVQIRARKGYYAPSDKPAAAPKTGVDAAFQEALDSPYDRDDVPLRMTHFVREETLLDKARVFVSTEVDIRTLGFEETDGRALGALQVLLVVVGRETGESFRYDQTVELKLLPAEREEMSRTWLPIVRDFELGPGKYQAKIVVRDKATGRVGTVVHELEVPDLASFRVSTPILSDVRETAPDGTPGDRLAILARREFPQGARLYCQFEVYGATRLEDSNMPKVSMGYEVRASDGAAYTRDRPSLIAPTAQAALSRLIGFSLEGATPGDYEMVLRFKDELSGKTLELHEPFSVMAPLPAPQAPNGK